MSLLYPILTFNTIVGKQVIYLSPHVKYVRAIVSKSDRLPKVARFDHHSENKKLTVAALALGQSNKS